jgi:hypothetical protein
MLKIPLYFLSEKKNNKKHQKPNTHTHSKQTNKQTNKKHVPWNELEEFYVWWKLNLFWVKGQGNV